MQPNSFEHYCRVHTCARYSPREVHVHRGNADGNGYSRQSSRPHAIDAGRPGIDFNLAAV